MPLSLKENTPLLTHKPSPGPQSPSPKPRPPPPRHAKPGITNTTIATPILDPTPLTNRKPLPRPSLLRTPLYPHPLHLLPLHALRPRHLPLTSPFLYRKQQRHQPHARLHHRRRLPLPPAQRLAHRRPGSGSPRPYLDERDDIVARSCAYHAAGYAAH